MPDQFNSLIFKGVVLVTLVLFISSCEFNSDQIGKNVSGLNTAQNKSGDSTENQRDPLREVRSRLPIVSSDDLLTAALQIDQLSSLIVFQDDEIKVEWYNGRLNRNRPINIKSASKNIISSLIGIAIDMGHIGSIDDPVIKYLPDYISNDDTTGKKDITIRHLLTMSSGLPSTSFGNYGRWVTSRDWIAFSLNGQLEAPPGTRMRYSTGDSHILSAVITRATGVSTYQFAQRNLFEPMGVRIGGWDRDPRGIYFGGNNLALSPGGLLAYGEMYLNNGVYNNRQIISADWVRESLEPRFTRTSFNPRGHDYGYLWWSNTFASYASYFAWGYGGQYVFILPELNAVVVITGNPDTRIRGVNNQIYGFMDTHIVPFLHRDI